MGKTIIPVGKTLGPYFNEAGQFQHFEIDTGDEVKKLTFDEAMIWGYAHENPETHYEHKFDRDELDAVIAKENKAMFNHDRDMAISRLMELGVLVEVDLRNDSLEPFLNKYRLIPTGKGLGNSAEKPHSYGIGLGEDVHVYVGYAGYFLWAFSYNEGSIWAGCIELIRNDTKLTIEHVSSEIASILPIAVATGCAYVERLS